MGQNKEELRRLLAFIDTLVRQPGNDEFVAGLRALLYSGSNTYDSEKLDQIYEYCIERNLRKQAQGYYESFPIKELVPELVDSYVLMESFKRKDDFLNFCAELFKQIEGITNYICGIKEYGEIFTLLYNCPAFIQFESGTPAKMTSPRKIDSGTIGKLLFDGFDKNKEGIEKCNIELKKQYTQDKIKIALYYAGYASCMYSPTEFTKITFDISKLFLVRCEADHSGNVRSDKQERIYQEVINNIGKHYVDFISLLNVFVEKISNGYLKKEELYNFALKYGITTGTTEVKIEAETKDSAF